MAKLEKSQKEKIKSFLSEQSILKNVDKLLEELGLGEFYVESLRIRAKQDPDEQDHQGEKAGAQHVYPLREVHRPKRYLDPCSRIKCQPDEVCREVESGGIIRAICIPKI